MLCVYTDANRLWSPRLGCEKVKETTFAFTSKVDPCDTKRDHLHFFIFTFRTYMI